MRSGGRSCLIEIWGHGDNAEGEPNPPFVLLKTVWGSLIPNRGSERFSDGQRQSLVRYSARLDYLDGQGITASMIAKSDGAEFNIVGVLVDHTTKKSVDLDLVEQGRGA